jgi:hypothetical protein
MSPNGDSCRLITALLAACVRRLRRPVPHRGAVRDAVLLAARGHDTLLDERRGAFRVVIIDKRRDRANLRVLVRVPGGKSVLGQR